MVEKVAQKLTPSENAQIPRATRQTTMIATQKKTPKGETKVTKTPPPPLLKAAKTTRTISSCPKTKKKRNTFRRLPCLMPSAVLSQTAKNDIDRETALDFMSPLHTRNCSMRWETFVTLPKLKRW